MGSRDVEGDGEALRGPALPGARMRELQARASGGAGPDRPVLVPPGAGLSSGRVRLEPRVVDGRDTPRVARGGVPGETDGDGVVDPDGDDTAVVRAGDRHLCHDETAGETPAAPMVGMAGQLDRSEEHTSELQSLRHLVCRLLLEKSN